MIACCALTFLCFPALGQSKLFKASVSKTWTLEKAKEEAFKDAKYTMDLSHLAPVDPSYSAHMKAIEEGKTELNGVRVAFFSNNYYAIRFLKTNETFYYDDAGNLVAYGLPYKREFPCKSCKYGYPESTLSEVFFDVSKNESYIFDAETKDLNGHWIRDKAFDKNGQVIMTRKFVEGP